MTSVSAEWAPLRGEGGPRVPGRSYSTRLLQLGERRTESVSRSRRRRCHTCGVFTGTGSYFITVLLPLGAALAL